MHIPNKGPRMPYFSMHFNLMYMGSSYTGIPFHLVGIPPYNYDVEREIIGKQNLTVHECSVDTGYIDICSFSGVDFLYSCSKDKK